MDNPKIENRGIDEAQFQIMCERFKTIPTLKTLGVELIYLGPGTASMKMAVTHDYTTIMNRLHGGIIATLADTIMGWSVSSLGKVGHVTLDMSLNYISSVFEGDVITAEGVVVHNGRTTVVSEATVRNSKDKLVARSRATFFVTTNKELDGAF